MTDGASAGTARAAMRCGGAPRVAALLLGALTAALLGVACAGASARAATFGAEGTGAGEFAQPRGIAVDQETGEVFVVDRNNERIDVFARSGVFLRAFGWGVAAKAEQLQTCTSRCFTGYAGSGSGELSGPEGVAVDNDPLSPSHGDVYVFDAGNLRVQKFTPQGEFLLMFGGEVNVTTKGDVCLAEEACKRGVAGTGLGQFQSVSGNPIAIDPAGAVFVGDKNRVQEFNPSGALEAVTLLPGAGSIDQLAVDSANALYVVSSALTGVRKYDLGGSELGTPRDASGAPGPLVADGETLFVSDGSGTRHVLQFGAGGEQQKSFGAGVPAGCPIEPRPEAGCGLAFDEAAEALYALAPTAVNVVALPPPGPLVVGQSASSIGPTSATVGASLNPEGPQVTSYRFEYGPTAAYGTSTMTKTLPSGKPFGDQSVSEAIAALSPGSVYHFRVVVTNAASETTLGPDETFTTSPPVAIESESVAAVTAFSARLQAQLDPQGSATEYRFQYGRTPAYGEEGSIPYASAGEGVTAATVAVSIQGLERETTYHYRVVARNAFGESQGADQTFTTQGAASTALIDGRAWEMVSPADKHGVTFDGISSEGGVIQAAEDGGAITYAAKAPITSEPEGNRSSADSQVFSKRTSPGAWATQDIATPHEAVAGLAPGEPSEYKLFSSSLESALVEPRGDTPLSPQAGERTPYRREASGAYEPLVTAANVPAGVKFGGVELRVGNFEFSPHLATATPDLSHVVVGSPQGLTPEVKFVENELENLYEWFDGRLTLASVLPDELPASSHGFFAVLGAGGFLVRNAISTDGSRIVFETRPEGHLYLRDLALGRTVQLDAPEAGLKEANGEPHYVAASSDDSRVFFLDQAKLTSDATASPEKLDLYECEIVVVAGAPSCALSDLSVDANVGESANVQGVIGADESGRYVYFVANGRLAAGAVAGDCVRSSIGTAVQSCNLYVRDTVSGTTRLIGVLSGHDFRSWFPAEGLDLGGLTARVSPNGRYLAFMSERPLTGFDNSDVAPPHERDEEVFEYDREADALTCVSCASSGARPEGVLDPGGFPGMLVDRPTLWSGRWLAASIPGWTRVNNNHALYQSRYLSNSGRLFFNSATPLVPSDTNGLEDVYEYEPGGVGACGLSSGCVGLISSGGSSEESAFIDASADGSDVFFLTSAQLLPQDTDNAYDLYDAHVCSSAAPCAPQASAPPPSCATADACRPAPPPQPAIFGAPASQTFNGSGNPAPATPVPSKPKPLTRAQKLSNALKACRKDRNRKKRAACERTARKRYGPPAKAKPKSKTSGHEGAGKS